MKLTDLYNRVLHFGRLNDPRKDKQKIKSFPDSGILFGRADVEVKKIMVGIDIEVAELLLADRIRQKEGLDLVIAHHPEGKAFADLHEAMRLQVDLLIRAGISRNAASRLMEERIIEVGRRTLAANHTRPVDAAKLLNIPFMNMHTPADNHVHRYLENLFAQKAASLRRVEDIVKLLNTIPEYKLAAKFNTGPRVLLGSPKRPVGKIMLEMTGGTEGPKEVYDKLYKSGIRTLVSMHLSEEHFKKVKDADLNVVIAGHISSDNLGMNLLLDNIEKSAKENFTVIDCSGFYRVKRK